MGRILRIDKVNKPVIDTSTTVRLPDENIVTIAGKQFTLTNNVVDGGVTGLGGLDVGPLVADSFYNMFAVNTGLIVGLVASLGEAPAGFNLYTFVGSFSTDSNGDTLDTFTPGTSSIFKSIEDAANEAASEDVKDFEFLSVSQIKMPASSILIGNSGTLAGAKIYTSADMNFDFANGTGDNGLDTGSETAWQWYALYAVPSGSGYVLKATIRNPITQPGPTGYTQWRYLGLFRNGQSTSATSDIARFFKLGSRLYFHTSFNSGSHGIRYDASVGPSTGVSQTMNLAFAGNGQYALPFDGTRCGWVLTRSNVGTVNELLSLTSIFWKSSTNNYHRSINLSAANGSSPQGSYGDVYCSSIWTPQVLTRTSYSVVAQFNWSLNLSSIIDPVLGRAANKI